MAGDVFLGYLHPNEVSSSFLTSLMALVGHDTGTSRRLGGWAAVKCAGGGIPEGRNIVTKNMLDTPSADWLFFIDADMGFEPTVLDHLLQAADPVERPIVGGLCFAQRELVADRMGGFRCVARPTILHWVKNEDGVHRFTGRDHFPVNSLVHVDATGAACLVIHRSVLERMRVEYGETWWTRTPGLDGALMGEDISFFARVAALEIPAYVHTGIRTSHMKNLWLAEEDYWSMSIAPPATERVDVIVPVLHRPENVRPLIESLRASTGLASVWFVCEPDDDVEIAEVEACGGNVIRHAGTFAQKVNEAYRQTAGTGAQWVLLVGDDVTFRPGWFDQACDVHRRYGPPVVGTNDLANDRVRRGEHATHPMIRRDYIDTHGASWDGPGVVCHEGYRHNFVDDEIVTVAKLRGAFSVALASQVEHHHPIAGKATPDPVYALGQSSFDADRRLFEKRLRAHVPKKK